MMAIRARSRIRSCDEHKWAPSPCGLSATKAMPDQLILKRDPNARYTESYNVPFLESEVRSEFHIVENEDSRRFVRT